jgi:hypothetical protein
MQAEEFFPFNAAVRNPAVAQKSDEAMVVGFSGSGLFAGPDEEIGFPSLASFSNNSFRHA